MNKIHLSLIVAMSKNRAIGINNELPWHISEDLRHFKAVTMGKPIIMGRKTYESIGRALPGRQNIVVTRQAHWHAEGVDIATSPEQALSLASDDSGSDAVEANEVFVIGGAELYSHTLHLAKTLYVTQVHKSIEGDAFFPEISSSWQEVDRQSGMECAKAGVNYDFVKFESVI